MFTSYQMTSEDLAKARRAAALGFGPDPDQFGPNRDNMYGPDQNLPKGESEKQEQAVASLKEKGKETENTGPVSKAMREQEAAVKARQEYDDKPSYSWTDYDTGSPNWTDYDVGKRTGTTGLGVGLDVGALGFGVGAGVMVNEDVNGDRSLGFTANYGPTTSWGGELVGTYQKTNAETVSQLAGQSFATGGEVSGKLGGYNIGAGFEHLAGDGYTGTNYNASIGLNFDNKLPSKAINASFKNEHTWTINVPKTSEDHIDLW